MIAVASTEPPPIDVSGPVKDDLTNTPNVNCAICIKKIMNMPVSVCVSKRRPYFVCLVDSTVLERCWLADQKRVSAATHRCRNMQQRQRVLRGCSCGKNLLIKRYKIHLICLGLRREVRPELQQIAWTKVSAGGRVDARTPVWTAKQFAAVHAEYRSTAHQMPHTTEHCERTACRRHAANSTPTRRTPTVLEEMCEWLLILSRNFYIFLV